MDKDVRMHLTPGIFFNLLLAIRKKPAANQESCFKDLLYIFDRSVKGLYGNSLKTIASRFRNCDPDLTSDYIRFGDPVAVDAFNDRLKDDYNSVVDEMVKYSDKYLDLQTNGKWIVRSLLQLIYEDDDIKENTKFLVIPGNVLAYRDDLRDMNTIHVYNFLLGIWHYICSLQNGKCGQETYLALSAYVSESRPRNFDKSRIGFNGFENIHLSYDTKLNDQTVRYTGLTATYLNGAGEETSLSVEGNVDQLFVKSAGEKADHGSEFTIEITQRNDKQAYNRFKTYLEHAKAKHQMKKTFLYETQRPFYSFFVCNDVKKRVTPVGSGLGGSHIPEPAIKNINIDAFPEGQRFIILSGTGGLGKSMMMTHFLLDTIEKNHGRIPIFVILRDYDPQKEDLLDFIFSEFKRHDPELRLPGLVELLSHGKAVILFDGLDEVKADNRDKLNKDLEVLVDSYPSSMFIISSRPTLNFRSFSRFMVYDLQAFSPEQSVEMIEKLDQSVIDPEIQKDFIRDLKNNRFKFNYDERTEFLGNPLFLTIMLLTYEGNHDIPTQRYLFYEQAYEAMAKKHDATKALTREFATGLNSRDFQKYFGEFCAITYEQEKYDFTSNEIIDFFQDVIDANGLETTPEAFIDDITGKICLIYLDGEKYYFVHRSFQEYFVAYFFSKQIEQNFDAVLEMMMSRDEGDHDSMVLPMLYGMDPQKTELCIFIPFLRELFEGRGEKDNYWHFLCRLYPCIYYEQGNTNGGCAENIAESSIYEFIAETYDIKEEVYGDDLPELDVMVDKEYVYYDLDWQKETTEGNRIQLIERHKLPTGYEEAYEEYNDEPIEIAGREYEIDVLRVFGSDTYKEVRTMLEAPDFPLKKEYIAMKKKFENLKETYDKKKPRKSFISRFH